MKKTFSLILAVVITVLVLTGCCIFLHESPVGEPLSLSIVIGAHKYFPKISTGSTKLADRIYEACLTYGNISSVVVDGKPATRANYSILKSGKDLTRTKEETIARQNAIAILNECASAKAMIAEVDTLEAMKVAAGLLNSSCNHNKLMAIYDSGLCTTGLISQLSGDLLSSDHNVLVDKLRDLHALPDLEGITVEWTGLGCTTGEQCAIPDSYKFKLKAMWTAIIEASGGTVVFDPTPISGEEAEGLPAVTPVPFIKDSLNAEDFASKEVFKEPVAFYEDTIKFVSDKAEFADPQSALKALAPVADLLKKNENLRITIAGTTASVGSFEGCFSLSEQRAALCKKILVEGGAKEEQIVCIGLGRAENCFRVDDLNRDGSLNEEMAKLNRAIYIFASESETARSLCERH